jgi:hypothetical protein
MNTKIMQLRTEEQITEPEAVQLAEIMTMPLVQRYLRILLWNTVLEQANIPLSTLVEEQHAHILKVAYIKGEVAILQTLLSIQRTKGSLLGDRDGNV